MDVESEARVGDAVRRGTAWLLARQEPSGAWDQACDAGAGPTAHALVALSLLGRLTPAIVGRGIDAFVAHQHANGSFGGFPGAREGDLGTTASVLAAARVAAPHTGSRRAELERVERSARSFVDDRGGADAVVATLAHGDTALFFWVAAGLVPKERLPRVPLAAVLLSGPGRALLATQAHAGLPLAIAELAVMRSPTPSNALHSIAQHDASQDPSGSFLDMVPQTALAALALLASGVAPSDARLTRLGDWLIAELSRTDPNSVAGWPVFHSSTWTTAMTLRTLLRAGVPASHDAVGRAARWLLSAQHDTPMMPSHQRDRSAPRTGGWAFQGTNRRFPDSDDTAVVLDALGTLRAARDVPPELAIDVDASIARGVAWLWGMQNDDGGWPAYAHGLPSKPPGAILTSTAPFSWSTIAESGRFVMGDPSTEDVTARVVRALSGLGYDRFDPRIARALAFLERMRDPRGIWWGRWSTNYLWASAHVLLGARAAGLKSDTRWLLPARRFLRAHQNGDGGYGETVETYRAPRLAGRGPSMAALSGLVLDAECQLGALEAPAHHLAAYLLRTQRVEGSWPEGEHLQVMIPPRAFYRYPAAATFQAIEGLAAYRARLA